MIYHIVYSIVIFIVISFFTGVGVLYWLLMGGKLAVLPIIIAIGFSAFLLCVFYAFGLLKRKNRKKGLLITIALLFVCTGGYLAKDLYHENVDTVSAEVNLVQYQPNMQGTKAATLEKKASLQLPNDNLLKLDGATALYPLYSAFAQATYPKNEYT